MTATTQTTRSVEGKRSLLDSIKTVMRDKPIVPLTILLIGLVVVLELVRPGIVRERWIANTLKFAIPLAILAAAQTLTMLTGGIDLSVGIVASMAAFIMGTQVPNVDPVIAITVALSAAALAGLASGIGVGIFRVHPLIMTLAIGLIVVGLLQLYQRTTLGTGTEYPEALLWLGTGVSTLPLVGLGVPNSLLIFIPLALIIGFGLKRSGFGRLLYAIGDNERAARLSGVRVWQVLIVLYVLSGLIAGIGGLVYVGLIQSSSLQIAAPLLLPSIAAAVIGGTSIFGGRGGYSGTIVGALILQVLATLLTVLQMPESTRRIIFGLIILVVTALYVRITGDR
ncbi:MAG: ABC transporter permease [Chloroflexota bacterium]